MQERSVTAVKMARDNGISDRRFRAALRKANLPWHRHGEPWTVLEGSAQHEDMIRVLKILVR